MTANINYSFPRIGERKSLSFSNNATRFREWTSALIETSSSDTGPLFIRKELFLDRPLPSPPLSSLANLDDLSLMFVTISRLRSGNFNGVADPLIKLINSEAGNTKPLWTPSKL